MKYFKVAVAMTNSWPGNELLDMRRWCCETIGDPKKEKRKIKHGECPYYWAGTTDWEEHQHVFHFASEQDAVLFALRWV